MKLPAPTTTTTAKKSTDEAVAQIRDILSAQARLTKNDVNDLIALIKNRLGFGGVVGTPASDWFPEKMEHLSVTNMEGEEIPFEYLKMKKMPPVAHPDVSLNILERRSDRVIFEGLMEEVKQSLGRNPKNLVVEGSPGVGKSRFYVYCAFRLISGLVDGEMKAHKYTLVLNFGKNYLTYLWGEKAFMRTTEGEVEKLTLSTSVLRLVEDNSSMLVGWNGVSIFFTSPTLAQLKDYKKGTNCKSFISPMWELTELRACNAIADEAHRLSDDELESRFVKWGGNLRFVFDETPGKVDAMINSAIASFCAQDVSSYSSKSNPLKDSAYRHCVFATVPTSPDYRTFYELEFVSKVVAAKIIERASDEMLNVLVRFALDSEEGDGFALRCEESDVAGSFRAQLYEIFAHRWFIKNSSAVVDGEKKAMQRTRSVVLRALDEPPQPALDTKRDAEAAFQSGMLCSEGSTPKQAPVCNIPALSGPRTMTSGKRKYAQDFANVEVLPSRKNRRVGHILNIAEQNSKGNLCHEPDDPGHLDIPEVLKSEWFDSLTEVDPTDAWTYYRPKSHIYAVDALMVELTPGSERYAGKCYGLKMTWSGKLHVDVSAVAKVANWAKLRGYQFVLVFVIPPKLESGIKWQSTQTLQGAGYKKSGMLQLVAVLDPYCKFRPSIGRKWV